MTRVMMYSHDTFGLGNIRRMLTIAKDLVDNDSRMSVLIVSGSPMLHAFRIPPRIDYLKLPCLSRNLSGDYAVKFLDLPYDQTIRLRANLCVSALLDFEPDIFIVDKKPLGVGNELAPALDLLQRRGKATKMVLLLRDILDSPQATRSVWRKNGYFETIEQHYDQVLVVGSEAVFDVAKEYDFPVHLRQKIRYCGYLRRERSTHAFALRAAHAPNGKSMVLVTSGGGEDGFRLIETYLDALRTIRPQARPHSVVVCGPEMPTVQRAKLINLTGGSSDVELIEFSDDMIGLMEAADVVVSMSGYNTVCEILTVKKRSILVPRIAPVLEQCIRAERLAQLGLARMIHPDDLNAAGLAHMLQQELHQANVHRRGLYQLDLQGLPRIRMALRELADEPKQQLAQFPPVTAAAI